MHALDARRRNGVICDRCRPRILRISLARNYVGLDGAMAIADIIRSSLSTPTMDGQNCNSELAGRHSGGRLNLCHLCQKFTTYRRVDDAINLDLLQNSLKDEGAIAIANAIRDANSCGDDDTSSSCIVQLGLERNEVGNAGLFSISRMLKTNNNLHTLRLGRNCITYEGITNGLAPALKVNNTLEVLSLMGNRNIGDRGAESLGKALRCNETLTTLLLAKCGISGLGAVHILKALYNDISPTCILVKSNHSLKEISLCCKSVHYIPGNKAYFGNESNETPIALKELIFWNKYGPATARRLKLQFFLSSSQGPMYVNATDLERELLPLLFYKLWKIERNDYSSNLPSSLGVMYSYLRRTPNLLER